MAKFNHLDQELKSFDSDKIWQAHSDIDSIESAMRNEHLAQEANRIQHVEHVRDEVHIMRIHIRVLILLLGQFDRRTTETGI